jgi:hypothetical protein
MPMKPTSCKIAVPVRLPSWLSGDLGKSIEQTFRGLLRELPGLDVTRLPRGFLVEAREAPGPLLEAVHRAVVGLEMRVEEAYPVLHHEVGPVWTGTLQAVFPTAPARDRTPIPAAAAPASLAPPMGAPEVA